MNFWEENFDQLKERPRYAAMCLGPYDFNSDHKARVLVRVLRIQGLDMPTAVRYLSESDAALQILGAAYIQHQCYHSNSAKNQVWVMF